jgi:hypothetical protein
MGLDMERVQIGSKILIMNGKEGKTEIGQVEAIHLEPQVLIYLDKNGEETFALFEEVIKTL